jgi:glutamyl-tRNA(Gln) amidotransferase subunit E
LSRLGIPLIEISTGPDMNTPQEAKETCERIGLLLRATGKVKRGIGTIRQDVNVSIIGGNRVEIKGAQDLAGIPTLIDYEILRQQRIIELASHNAFFTGPIRFFDVTSVFEQTECKFVAKAIDKGEFVFGASLPNMAGILGFELQPNKRVGSDLSDYLKVHHGVGGIIHSDETLSKYNFSQNEITSVREALGCSSDDAFVLLVGDASKRFAFGGLFDRLNSLATGVPKEVRRANADYTTTYMRPMPGAARMYPETDCLPVQINAQAIVLPELIEEKIARYIELGVAHDEAKTIAKSEDSAVFDMFLSQYGKQLKATTIADILFNIPKNLKKKDGIDIMPTSSDLDCVFAHLRDGTIAVGAISDILKKSHNSQVAVESIIDSFMLMSDSELESIVRDVVSTNVGSPVGKLMGLVMARTASRADGRVVGDMLKKIIG